MAVKRGRPTSHRARWGTVRRQKSGHFTASYRHGGIPGVIPSVEYFAPHTFETEGDARVWLAMERRLIDSGAWTPPADRVEAQRQVELAELTLAEYAGSWLAQAMIRDSTRVLYERLLRLHILPKLGAIPLAKLDRPRVATWWRGLDHSKQRTCDLAYSLLRTVMLAAVDDGLITENPCRVKGAGRPARRRSIEPLTPAQVQAIADGMPERWRIGVLLGAWLALRSGEVRELRRKDIVISDGAGVVKVSRGVARAGSTMTAGAPKTEAGRRTVAIPAPLLADVKRHLLDHTQLGPEGLLVWDAVTGSHVDDNSWRRAWLAACKSAGVEGYTFHSLRHTGLTYAATAGATIRELQVMAGHTTAVMAIRYQEVAADHMADVVAGLGQLIESGRK